MPYELASYIEHYGYLALLLLVFSQETGFPNPIPNEFVLVFSGYLAFTRLLSFPFVIATAFLGDILAATILYTVFYFFGSFFLNKKTAWMPVSRQTVDKQMQKLKKRGKASIILGRLTPFIRGYVAVICGLIQLKPPQYGLIVLGTSMIWAWFYVTAGFLLGPYWNFVIQHIDQFKYVLYLLLVLLCVAMIVRYIINRQNDNQ